MDYTPSAIKIAPYYKQLLKWCDSVDVIRSPPYDGPPARYPDREHDQISCASMDDELNNHLDTDCLSNTSIKMPDPYNTVDQSSDTVGMGNSNPVAKPAQYKRKNVKKPILQNTGSTYSTQGIKRKRNVVNQPIKKPKHNDDCIITDTVNVIGPNRTVWPEYRYHQTDERWQQQACTRLGIRFVCSAGFQPGGPDTVLTRPDLRSLRNVQPDGNCCFRALSYVTTGTEAQHMEIREAILSYMLSIENLLIGHDSTGHANFLEPFNVHNVQEYIG